MTNAVQMNALVILMAPKQGHLQKQLIYSRRPSY